MWRAKRVASRALPSPHSQRPKTTGAAEAGASVPGAAAVKRATQAPLRQFAVNSNIGPAQPVGEVRGSLLA